MCHLAILTPVWGNIDAQGDAAVVDFDSFKDNFTLWIANK
jgi:hypothetical protein